MPLRRMGSVHRATGSHPRRCLTDWRYSHSMASLSRWASCPPLVKPAMWATPRRVPTETTNPFVVEGERLQLPALQLRVQVSGHCLALLQRHLCQRRQHVPTARIRHRGKVASDVDLRVVQHAQVPVDLDTAIVAGRQPRIGDNLGCFTPPAQTNTPPSTSWPAIAALVRIWTPRSDKLSAAAGRGRAAHFKTAIPRITESGTEPLTVEDDTSTWQATLIRLEELEL